MKEEDFSKNDKLVMTLEGIRLECDTDNWIVKIPKERKEGSKKQAYDYKYFNRIEYALERIFDLLLKKNLTKHPKRSLETLVKDIESIRKDFFGKMGVNDIKLR
jgi:hypothetical protein